VSAVRGIVVVTGTDTGVGKTIATAAIAAAAIAAGKRVAVVKPAQTGEDDDAATVRRLANPDVVFALVSYPDPLAPAVAARVSGREPLELKAVVEAAQILSAEHDLVLVEGSGGLLVPMGPQWTMADFAMETKAPAIVVTRPALGTLNHTALTLEALRHRGIASYLVLGTWPNEPELVHRTNLEDLPAPLYGWLPENAAQTRDFRASAPKWLAPALYGVSTGFPW
jgi:dethiobiotin synthetase